MVQDLLDELSTFAAEGVWAPALAGARPTYEARTGQIVPGEPSFERRIAAFLEWFVLDANGTRLLDAFAEARGDGLSPAQLAALAALRLAPLRLLELRKFGRDGAAYLTDLVDGGAHVVARPHVLLGCAPKSVVLARLVPLAGETVLTDGITYVPTAARKQARAAGKALRRHAADARALQVGLSRLAFVTHRCERYRHVDPKVIFGEWSRAEAVRQPGRAHA